MKVDGKMDDCRRFLGIEKGMIIDEKRDNRGWKIE